MSQAPLTAPVQRLHQLGWQPGTAMHQHWWAEFGLTQWRDSYQRYRVCRPHLDRLIVEKRGFPNMALPAELNERQTALLSLEHRFTDLITALGVIALDCPDHLLIKPYRTVLAKRLGERCCDQLFALYTGWKSTQRVAQPEQLIDAAFDAGVRWWLRDAHHCIVYKLLATLLPPVSGCSGTTPGLAPAWLLKIERFL